MIKVKRAYDSPAPGDGTRILVDRLWPRGLKRERLKIDSWLKEAAPSRELHRWFAHDPKKWDLFRRRYFAELDGKTEVWRPMLRFAGMGLTLVYSARDARHNNAIALQAYLTRKFKASRRP